MSKARSLSNLFSGSTDAATDAEVTSAIASHNSATTSVHGISNTANLATSSSVSSSVSSGISTHNTSANGHIGRGNTASRPASPVTGDLYFDTDLNKVLVYVSGNWLPVTTVTAPGVPTSVSATAGSTQATVTWTAPVNNGGSDITDYNIQYSSNSGSTWTTFSDGTSTSTSATVTGLTNNTAYVFRVRAINLYGNGDYSSATSSVTPTQVTYSYTFSGVTGSGGNGTGNGKHYDVYFGASGFTGAKIYASNGTVLETLSNPTFNDYCSPTPSFSSNGGSGSSCEPYRTYTWSYTTGSLPAGAYIYHDNGGYGGGTVSLSISNGGRTVTTVSSQGNGNCYKVVLA